MAGTGMIDGLKNFLIAIWHLTKPYFNSRNIGEIRVWPFGTFRAQERWIGLFMLTTVVVLALGGVALNVVLSYWNNNFYNALQAKDEGTFWSLLGLFCILATVWITRAVIAYVVRSYLVIRWRRVMTDIYLDRWMSHHAHYRMRFLGQKADNPDQRIQEDIDQFVTTTLTLFLGLLTSVVSLFSFAFILWNLSSKMTLPFTDITIPGFLFWVALIYSVAGTIGAHYFGRKLIHLNFMQQRYEADFRFGMARVREYGEQIALMEGDQAERSRLGRMFSFVVQNFLKLVGVQKILTAFTSGYGQAAVVFPFLLTAHNYFSGRVTFGDLMQTNQAFGQVQDALSFFVDAYSTVATYKAIVDRLTGFDETMQRAAAVGADTHMLNRHEAATGEINVDDATLATPTGETILTVPHLALEAGHDTLIAGPSGSGKSTLFRAIAGIWPYAEGTLTVPAGKSLMLLPQQPYIPLGTLREAVTYPAQEGAYDDAAIRDALTAVELSHLIPRLDEAHPWQQRLSGGEQQRIAIARALLARPDWLLLDEATAALDEKLEQTVYKVIADKLPNTTVVSIGHRSTLNALHDRRILMERQEDGLFSPVPTGRPVSATPA
ncbi:putative ATP-binding cassette transporter [Chelatococcus asaccharovorans]|uniref:Putative ATP-binding cassette transporter n=1 Tax=Chelatococcus asaccharovorans TaxID=28210 RepID=A0A2V3UDM6_9HYPH|nr:putative ATP-binding cassette transporter [Chelatococcus asaccharovorans]